TGSLRSASLATMPLRVSWRSRAWLINVLISSRILRWREDVAGCFAIFAIYGCYLLIVNFLTKHIIDFFARRNEILETEGKNSASARLGYRAVGYETAGNCLSAGTGAVNEGVF